MYTQVGILWQCVCFLTAIVVLIFLGCILESVISAKIDEMKNRKRIKKVQKECIKELESTIHERIDKMLGEIIC